MVLVLAIALATYAIDLISETPLGGFDAKFIRVEHNTTMLFSLDTLTGDVTTKFVDCADPVTPIIGCECVIPTALDGGHYEYHPLDTDDSLFAVFSDTNAIDFYDHSGDSLVFLRTFVDPTTDTLFYIHLSDHLQFYDTFLVAYRPYYDYPIYNISDLDSIFVAGIIDTNRMMFAAYPTFDAEAGLFCTTNGCDNYVYSLRPETFCEFIGRFARIGDWCFLYIDIDSNNIFIEGSAFARFEAGTLSSTPHWPPEREYFLVPFEIWGDYIIKSGRNYFDSEIAHIDWSGLYPCEHGSIIRWAKYSIFRIRCFTRSNKTPFGSIIL